MLSIAPPRPELPHCSSVLENGCLPGNLRKSIYAVYLKFSIRHFPRDQRGHPRDRARPHPVRHQPATPGTTTVCGFDRHGNFLKQIGRKDCCIIGPQEQTKHRPNHVPMISKLNSFLSSLVPAPAADIRPQHTLQLATAVLLIEVMQSDAECAFEEQAAILRILKEHFHMTDAEVKQLTEQGQQASRTANDFHQFTSLINRELALPEKLQIVEYLWQVVYADGHVSAHENHIMRRLVDLLHISHGDNIAAKTRAKPADSN